MSPETGLRFGNLWIACGAGFVALVIFLSLTPNPVDAPVVIGMKTGHMLAYCWLMFWFSQIYQGTTQRIGIALALVLMGVGLEYIQGTTTYRHFAYSDMRDNAIGVMLGWICAHTPLRHLLPWVDSAIPVRRST